MNAFINFIQYHIQCLAHLRVLPRLCLFATVKGKGLENFDDVQQGSALGIADETITTTHSPRSTHQIKNALMDQAGRCTCPPELMRCECGRVKHVKQQHLVLLVSEMAQVALDSKKTA